MQLVSVWSDLYASTFALYTGHAGGHRWLVAARPEQATAATAALAALGAKGETVLLVYAGLTPLAAALHAQTDPVLGRGLAGVLVLDRDLARGPATDRPLTEVEAAHSGLRYQEGGHFPAWQDALGSTGEQGEKQGECAPASVCAQLGLPVRVCAPEALTATLHEWWAATPHALAAD